MVGALSVTRFAAAFKQLWWLAFLAVAYAVFVGSLPK
jgi:hypothetical protein